MAVTIEIIKQKILDQAMRGELVEQDANDEPAESILKRIKEKKIKKRKLLQPIEKEEIPYELPKGWEWTRLGELISVSSGNGLTSTNMNKEGDIPVYGGNGITGYHDDYNCDKPTLVIGRVGFYCGSVHIIAGKSWVTDNAFLVRYPEKEININWLFYMLQVINLRGNVSSTAQPVISGAKIYPILAPLPPLNEQKRIVEKIHSLFGLCDKWKTEVEKQQTYFSVLRDKVLDDAMRGLLVKQDENDEPIEVFLQKIRDEKAKLIKDQKIKKQKPLPTVENEEIPYTLPKEWKWMRLGEIGSIFGGGTPKTSNPKFWAENEIPWLTPADLSKHVDKYISRGKRDISLAGLNGSSTRLLPAGSVLFSSRAPIGYVAIAKNELATNQGFKSVVPYIQECNQYLYYYLKFVGNKINERASGTTFKEISGKQLSLELIAIPPIQEQQRIVKKIERLFGYIDELESQITLPK